MLFQIEGECGWGGVRQFVYDTNRPAFLEGDMVGLCVNGNWQICIRYCGGEAVFIHMVRKGTAGFSIVECITNFSVLYVRLFTLEKPAIPFLII